MKAQLKRFFWFFFSVWIHSFKIHRFELNRREQRLWCRFLASSVRNFLRQNVQRCLRSGWRWGRIGLGWFGRTGRTSLTPKRRAQYGLWSSRSARLENLKKHLSHCRSCSSRPCLIISRWSPKVRAHRSQFQTRTWRFPITYRISDEFGICRRSKFIRWWSAPFDSSPEFWT